MLQGFHYLCERDYLLSDKEMHKLRFQPFNSTSAYQALSSSSLRINITFLAHAIDKFAYRVRTNQSTMKTK